MVKIILTLIANILITLLVIAGLIVASQDANPTSSLYTLKRVGETILFMTKITPQEKAAYYEVLLDRRLQEVKRVYKEKQYEALLETSLRYSSTAGIATQYIVQHNLTDASKQLKEVFENDKVELEKMRNALPKNNVDGKYLTDAINYTTTYAEQLP